MIPYRGKSKQAAHTLNQTHLGLYFLLSTANRSIILSKNTVKSAYYIDDCLKGAYIYDVIGRLA